MLSTGTHGQHETPSTYDALVCGRSFTTAQADSPRALVSLWTRCEPPRIEPADVHGQQAAARPQHPPGLSKGVPALRRLGQVLEGPEQQHRILRLGSLR